MKEGLGSKDQRVLTESSDGTLEQCGSPPKSYTEVPEHSSRLSLCAYNESEPHHSPSSPGLRNRRPRSHDNNLSLSDAKSSATIERLNDSLCISGEVMETSSGSSNYCSQTSRTALPNEALSEIHATIQQETIQDGYSYQNFWRTYDDIVFLSLFAILGIVFRMLSAAWFRLELGVVFSDDSALSTNIPLNCWSCFLLGLLCTGRDSMSIVYAKALVGSNSGRGIISLGKYSYRRVVDTGRAALNSSRGFRIVDTTIPTENDTNGVTSSDPQTDNTISNRVVNNLHRNFQAPKIKMYHRKSHPLSSITSSDNIMSVSPGRRASNQICAFLNDDSQLYDNDHFTHTISPEKSGNDSIADLLGLNDEFRIRAECKGEEEVRKLQLRALTRRIIASPYLILFPARKESIDVLEHYQSDSFTEALTNSMMNNNEMGLQRQITALDYQLRIDHDDSNLFRDEKGSNTISRITDEKHEPNNPLSVIDSSIKPHKIHTTITVEDEYQERVNDNFAVMKKLNFVDGWDIGNSADEMKHQILLGLRVGFCGAVSTWASWNSAMIDLMKAGKIGEALVGYCIGIQLGVVCYRFGQIVAVYFFVWRCQRETKRDEKRGYGLRLRTGTSDSGDDNENQALTVAKTRDLPSIRAVATSLFVTIMISLSSAIYFFPQHQQFSISLLFTPFGCLTRWRLQKEFNRKLPGFPLGTFACNLLSCALSGSLGSFLAGNPGPEEKIVLTSMIAGFSASLSTFAGYIAEVLSLIDPIILKFDGFAYALITIAWGMIIGFFSSQAKNWADNI